MLHTMHVLWHEVGTCGSCPGDWAAAHGLTVQRVSATSQQEACSSGQPHLLAMAEVDAKTHKARSTKSTGHLRKPRSTYLLLLSAAAAPGSAHGLRSVAD
jgi:hypothetical protein